VSRFMYDSIHVRKSSFSDFNVPGWNTYVKEKHDIARDAFLGCTRHGKPKIGFLFENMKRTRALFKLALRYYKNHIEEMKADACADTLMEDCHKFWNHIYKISDNEAVNHVSNIGDVSGSENITQMLKNISKTFILLKLILIINKYLLASC